MSRVSVINRFMIPHAAHTFVQFAADWTRKL